MTKTVKPKKRVNEDSFNKIKDLTNLSTNNKKIAELLEVSYITVLRVRNCKDWNEYRENTLKSNPHNQNRPRAKVESVLPGIATLPYKDELGRIASALERLADAWEAEPKRSF